MTPPHQDMTTASMRNRMSTSPGVPTTCECRFAGALGNGHEHDAHDADAADHERIKMIATAWWW